MQIHLEVLTHYFRLVFLIMLNVWIFRLWNIALVCSYLRVVASTRIETLLIFGELLKLREICVIRLRGLVNFRFNIGKLARSSDVVKSIARPHSTDFDPNSFNFIIKLAHLLQITDFVHVCLCLKVVSLCLCHALPCLAHLLHYKKGSKVRVVSYNFWSCLKFIFIDFRLTSLTKIM